MTERPPSLLALPSYLASQLSKYGARQLARALAEHELALIHNGILVALDDLGPLSQQQLADSLDFDKSHLVGHIDLLENRGLIARRRDQADRRRNEVTLTPGGEQLLAELRPAAERSQQGFLEALSAAERKTLVELLGRALAANDAARIGAEPPSPPRGAL